jgi:hypothetical protein
MGATATGESRRCYKMPAGRGKDRVQRDLLAKKQGDFLQQKPTIHLRSRSGVIPIAPQPRKVSGQPQDRCPIFLILALATFFASALVLFLRLSEQPHACDFYPFLSPWGHPRIWKDNSKSKSSKPREPDSLPMPPRDGGLP